MGSNGMKEKIDIPMWSPRDWEKGELCCHNGIIYRTDVHLSPETLPPGVPGSYWKVVADPRAAFTDKRSEGKPCDTDPVNMRPLASINHNLERIADHLDELFGSPAHKKMRRFETKHHPEDVAPPKEGILSSFLESLDKTAEEKHKIAELFERVNSMDEEGGTFDVLRDLIADKASDSSVAVLRKRIEAIEEKIRS